MYTPGMYLVAKDAMCEMARDVWHRVLIRTGYELTLAKVMPDGSSQFTLFDGEVWGCGPSVTLNFKVLPSDDYGCAIRITVKDGSGIRVGKPFAEGNAETVYMLLLHLIGTTEDYGYGMPVEADLGLRMN